MNKEFNRLAIALNLARARQVAAQEAAAAAETERRDAHTAVNEAEEAFFKHAAELAKAAGTGAA